MSQHKGDKISRGYVKRSERAEPFASPVPKPLTDTQKARIRDLASQGYRDRQIAQELDLSEGRIAHYRQRIGICMVQNRGSHGDEMFKSLVRPGHVRGTSGDTEDRTWFESCDAAFQEKAREALASGGW